VYAIIEVRRLRRERAREVATWKARVATEERLGSLVRKREQLVKNDTDGRPFLDEWTEEIARFIAHYIKPTLTRRERFFGTHRRCAEKNARAGRNELIAKGRLTQANSGL
jgi:hypothetical protein